MVPAAGASVARQARRPVRESRRGRSRRGSGRCSGLSVVRDRL